MSRTDRVLKGLGASYLVTGFNIGVRFFITPFFLKVLGPELMGLRYLVAEIMAYLSFTDVGVGQLIRSLVAKDLQGDPESETYQTSLHRVRAACQIQQAISVVALILSAVFAFYLEYFSAEISPENMLMCRVFTLATGLAISLNFSSITYLSYLQGKQILAETSLYSLISSMLNNGIGFILVYWGWSLYGLAVAVVVSAGFQFVQLRVRTKWTGIQIKPFSPPLEKKYFSGLYKMSIWIFLGSISSMLLDGSSKIITAFYPDLGLNAVTIVSLTLVLPVTLRSQGIRLSTIIRPGLTQQFHSPTDSHGAIKTACLLLKITGVLAAAIFATTLLINLQFLDKWVGEEYSGGNLANWGAAIIGGASVLAKGLMVLTDIQLDFRSRFFAQFGATIIGIGVALILAKNHGVGGILIGIASGIVLARIPLLAIPARRVFKNSPAPLVMIARCYTLPTVMLIFWIFINRFVLWRPTGWIELLVSGAVIGGSTFLIGVAWVWRDLKVYPGFRWIDGVLRKWKHG